MELTYLYSEIEDEYGIRMSALRGTTVREWVAAARASYELHTQMTKAEYLAHLNRCLDVIYAESDLALRRLALRAHLTDYDLIPRRPRYFARIVWGIYVSASLAVLQVMSIGGFLLFIALVPITYFVCDGWRPRPPRMVLDRGEAFVTSVKQTWSDDFVVGREFSEIEAGILALIRKHTRREVTLDTDLVKDLGFE